ncbi:hypothetical protein MKZ38_007594 [Zalerion maritima]|uniref:W2 domain-containing protein n=1 Tax=Zalerion maritima TaxID=339359 RepID=A0AAD5RVU3_9PEZI|nr:hypothetical protein MKZ38_007594 [Zalerion maritima]
MAALINIRRDVTDTFYRYKMEKIQTKIEGKGNGIKTVITNLSSIANSLARDGNIVIKYFGFELGAQTNTNPADDRWIINGAHEAAKLQDSLDGFINRFVLCKKCKNPETDFVYKDGRILLDCKACGQRSDVDIRLKLSGFILKNQEKKSKSSKAERKAARRAKQNGNKDGSGSEDRNSENGANNEENGFDGSDGDANGFEKVDSPVAATDEQDEHEWAVDMDPAAVRARQQSLPDEFKQKMSLEEQEDGEGGGHTAYDQLGDWIQAEAKDKGGIDKVDDVHVYLKAQELGIESKHRTVLVLVQTLFNQNICSQVPKRSSMLKKIISGSEKHEKALLGGTERLVAALGDEYPDLYNQIVKVLQLYYHYDLLSEDVATKWGTRASKKYVDIATSKKIRKSAEPFLRWLEEAEEDSSEEDE